MNTDQIQFGILQIRYLMNVAALRDEDRAGRNTSRLRADQHARTVGEVRGFRGYPLHHKYAANRLAMVVNRTALAAPPAEYENLVVACVINQVPLIRVFAEMDAAAQRIAVDLEARKSVANRFLGQDSIKRVPFSKQVDSVTENSSNPMNIAQQVVPSES